MNRSLGALKFCRFGRAAAFTWLCGSGAAWAGGGGEDAGTLQQTLDAACQQVGMTNCPQLPTAAQIVAEISGLINSPPDDVRSSFALTCGILFIPTGVPCTQVAINALTAPVKSPPAGPLAISYLTPLAFQPGALVTQYGDPNATRFLYAAVIEGPDGQPQVLDIVLDDTLGRNKQFSKGQVVTFSLPLVILNGGSETPVTATLTLTATCNGAANCLTGTVAGVLPATKPSPSAAQLGIQFSSTFGPSPNSATAHQIYELQIPIVATSGSDGAYFATFLTCPNGNGANAISGYCNAFSKPALGFSASVLSGASIGIAPYAAPLCPGNTCPDTPPATTYFGICAKFPKEMSPAVATFLQIGTDGTTTMTTPVDTQRIVCPPQS